MLLAGRGARAEVGGRLVNRWKSLERAVEYKQGTGPMRKDLLRPAAEGHADARTRAHDQAGKDPLPGKLVQLLEYSVSTNSA